MRELLNRVVVFGCRLHLLFGLIGLLQQLGDCEELEHCCRNVEDCFAFTWCYRTFNYFVLCSYVKILLLSKNYLRADYCCISLSVIG